MSETAINESTSAEAEKPVEHGDDVKFPPFPDPKDADFEDDISQTERDFYVNKFPDLNAIKSLRLHCTACDRHLGCSARNEARMRSHPMLRTLVCHTCHSFYNSGEFDKGEDGSELYCRWCGQGGQVYCCSDCCHVFCAKCVKRNLGVSKIKEIENTDDWKCFKCNPECLWDMRATCWALLRYCDLKNKVAYITQDSVLKDAYQKDCAIDHTVCCKNKVRRRQTEKADVKKKEIVERADVKKREIVEKADVKKREIVEKADVKKKETEMAKKAAAAATAISKIPPTIQVKKFASINLDDLPKEKKAQKRACSPKTKVFLKNPIHVQSGIKLVNPVQITPTGAKKPRMMGPTMMNPVRFQNNRPSFSTYVRNQRPRLQPPMPVSILNSQLNNQYNGYNSPGMYSNMIITDNINLSLESLTQGLNMAAVAMANNPSQLNDDVVCTPDFPMEPLCEVTEENPDDDVQCITPGPVAAPKVNTPPPLVSRIGQTHTLSDLTPDNIIQMTENDVTVNAATGGLKFRVDPQTLSSNKMYRLPDGRIFAINPNPNMPGGYSATIVALTEANTGKVTPKGATYAAKLSAVTSPRVSTPTAITKANHTRSTPKRKPPKAKDKVVKIRTQPSSSASHTNRECDLNVPVEWYRYNLIDAVDALEYSMMRLQKLKKEATTMFLRTRTTAEMRTLHKNLERLLQTSSKRFIEIQENLNKEMKEYIAKKMGESNNVSDDDDDDDVEILNDLENDDPIFIDENSLDSNINNSIVNDTQEVDLTGAASSEHNDSGGKSTDHNDSFDKDALAMIDKVTGNKPDEDGDASITANLSEDNNMNKIKKVYEDVESENSNRDDTERTTEQNVGSGEADRPTISTLEGDDINGNVERAELEDDEKCNDDSMKENGDVDEEMEDVNKSENKIQDSEISESKVKSLSEDKTQDIDSVDGDDKLVDIKDVVDTTEDNKLNEDKLRGVDSPDDKVQDDMSDDKTQDAEISEEMIETLLKEDSVEEDVDNRSNCLDV